MFSSGKGSSDKKVMNKGIYVIISKSLRFWLSTIKLVQSIFSKLSVLGAQKLRSSMDVWGKYSENEVF